MSTAAFRRPRVRKYRVPKGFAREVGPPFERVLELGKHHDRLRYGEAGALALLAHGLVVLLAIFGNPPPIAVPPKRREIVVSAAPPPPPAPKPEPPKPPPPEAPKVSRPRVARNAPPPPAPKQAGKVVAAAADPNAPMDMTGFSMPVGEGNRYEGGPVSAKAPPPGPPAPAAVVRTAPRPPAPPAGPSLAKPPGPARHNWACTWPDDEQDSDLRDAKVSIRVAVTVDGDPDRVDVLSAPKPSFADAARKCALSETYRPALNDAGTRIPALTPPFNVHFVR